MPTEKGKLGPRPSKRNLLMHGAGGIGWDGAGTGPRQPSPSHASRVSFSSRLQVQQPPSPAPAVRGDRPSRPSRLQLREKSKSPGSRPSSARLARGQGPRSRVSSPVPLPPPANTAARGQCRRLRSCAACSGKATPETRSATSSTPPTPVSIETLVHEVTQTEPADDAERVARDTQTESPPHPRVRLYMDGETQTEPPVLPRGAGASAGPGSPEPPRRRQRLSLLRRLLRACSCTRAQPERLGPKRALRPQAAARAHTPGIDVLMVLQEAIEEDEWAPCSCPWLVETSL